MVQGFFDNYLSGTPFMAIFRNFTPDRAVVAAHTAWDLGIDLVEVPIQTPDAIPTLQAVVAEAKNRGKYVGSGTIVSLDQLEVAVREGVAFGVAPGFDIRVVEESIKIGLPFLPGVATPTEIQYALSAGLTWVKAFPASTLTPQWFELVRGPFPSLKIVATGGISAANARDFLNSGASAVAVGSALNDPDQMALLLAS